MSDSDEGVDAPNQQYEDVVRLRMERENCNSGELHGSLIWNDIADLAFQVITPSGEHICWYHLESNCGGWLDKDMNAGKISLKPIENIFWASAPSGHYKFFVLNYNNRTDPKTVFTDPNRKVPFRVRLKRDDKVEWFTGAVGPRETMTCFEFDYQGSGAIGSYIVIPPAPVKSTFEELCKLANVTYTKGSCYYAVKKKEKISKKKNMIIHDNDSDTFIIGSVACRTLLNKPLDANITVTPKELKDEHTLFVQSTSYNRGIPPNTKTLMKVSIKEALKYRCGDKYTFT